MRDHLGAALTLEGLDVADELLADHDRRGSAGRPLAAIDPAHYGSGLKLSVHTRADTALMTAVETLLALDGGARLVWAGDDDEPDIDRPDLYWLVEPHHFVRFAGLIDPTAPVAANTDLPVTITDTHRYLCNTDKKQYLDKARLPHDDYGIRRSPLPWLTAEGGPTTRGRRTTWARDRIYLSAEHPGHTWTQSPTLLWA